MILIPNAIRQAKTAQLPTFNPPNLPIPQYPGDAPKRINTTLIVAETIVTVILSSVVDNIVAGNLGTTLLIGGLSAIAAQTWRQFTTFSRRKQKYHREIADYRQDKQKRERQKRSHYQQKQAAFQRDSVLEALSKTIPHDGDRSEAYPGDSEAKFYSYLKKYFGNNIHTKLTLDIRNFQHPYSPDFTYIDHRINLYVDVEIDEPYSYKDKKRKPIHYIGLDAKRDRFFLEKGWIIIRFSEEQIVCYPESCCKVIAETISSLVSDNSIISRFDNVFPLPKRKRWTKNEAEEMARIDYRKTYLSRSR